MDEEYTPTTDDVRERWAWNEEIGAPLKPQQDEFNRWLRGRLADAWDSAIYHVEPMLSPADRRAAHADNPYREAS